MKEGRAILQEVLKEVVERKASDVHMGPGFPPMLRVLGDLEPSRVEALAPEESQSVAHFIMREDLRARFEEKREVDFSFSVSGGARFRVNVYSQKGGVNIAMRLIPSEVPTISGLGLPPAVQKLAEEQRGLILVTGTTGSGKSTTLAAMIDHINSTRKANVITIEDPIEFLHKNKKSIVNQRELGLDTFSYTGALRHVVRQDPDVVLLGEMRDHETMAAAITSAQTGHLVLSTVHSTDTVQTVNRIVDMFPPHQQNQIRLLLADSLRGVISQRLLQRSDVAGRVAAIEILVATSLVRKAIEENTFADIHTAMKQGQYYGMQTFNQALIALYNEGKIKLDDALAAASNPEEIMLHVRGIETGGHTTAGMFE